MGQGILFIGRTNRKTFEPVRYAKALDFWDTQGDIFALRLEFKQSLPKMASVEPSENKLDAYTRTFPGLFTTYSSEISFLEKLANEVQHSFNELITGTQQQVCG